MILLLILFSIAIIIIVGSYFLIKILSNRKPKPAKPNLKSGSEIAIFTCSIPNSKHINISAGEKFNTWNRPNTKIISLFKKGYSGGQGKIAEITDPKLLNIINEYHVDGIILEVNKKEFKAKLYIR